MLSEDALRAGAVACFTNAQELYEEANLLFEQARSPRSAALALIGAEEFAKAVVFTVAALLPEQRHCLPYQ
jgi:AbiV family abortive infection protein